MSKKARKDFSFLKPEKSLSPAEKEAAERRFISTGAAEPAVSAPAPEPPLASKAPSAAVSSPSSAPVQANDHASKSAPQLYSSGRYKKVNIYLEPERHKALKIEATRQGADISSYIRSLLDKAGLTV